MEPNPSTSFYFELLFKDEKIAFQEVSGISTNLNVEAVNPIEDHFKYKIPTSAKYDNLTLKRGVLPANSKFTKWCSESIGGGLTKAIQPHDVSVALLDSSGQELAKWTFHEAWPVAYKFSDLKYQENLIIESTELTYTYFERTSIK